MEVRDGGGYARRGLSGGSINTLTWQDVFFLVRIRVLAHGWQVRTFTVHNSRPLLEIMITRPQALCGRRGFATLDLTRPRSQFGKSTKFSDSGLRPVAA